MTTLIELRDMLAKAEGPSRELDDIIALMLDGYVVRKIGRLPHFTTPEEMLFAPPGKPAGVPSYTSSIDAALALVERLLPGWLWCAFYDGGGVFGGTISRRGDIREPRFHGKAYSPPIAILLALVEALIAEEKTDG